MLRIGDFSKLSKVTIKALRYYEKEGLLIPKNVDVFNGYRYYESNQLLDVARIISLKQIGLSIDEIMSDGNSLCNYFLKPPFLSSGAKVISASSGWRWQRRTG